MNAHSQLERLTLTVDKMLHEGNYGGRITAQVVSAVVRASNGGWRIMRVHPSAVKLLAWQGLGAVPQRPGGRLGAIGRAGDVPQAASPLQPSSPECIVIDEDE